MTRVVSGMNDVPGKDVRKAMGQRLIGFRLCFDGRFFKASYYSLAMGKSSTRAWYIQTLRRTTIFP